MQAGNSEGTNEPTEKIPSNEPNRDFESNLRLRLAFLAKMIDEKAYASAIERLRQDPAFDVRSHLENAVGLDPAQWMELEQLLFEMLESGWDDTERIDESVTDAIRIAEDFEMTFATRSSPDEPFKTPESGANGAETVQDTYGKKPNLRDPGGFDRGDAKQGGHERDSVGFSRYRPLQRISKGGQALVLRAWDMELKRRFVALKTIDLDEFRDKTPRDQKFDCDRLIQEAFITSRLNHPSVIPIYALDYWTLRHLEQNYDHLPDGIPFLVLPYYPNGDLSKEIDKLHPSADSKRLETAQRDLLFRERIGSLIQVCRAVAHGHERGIIHRDIKPKNVLLGHHGEVYLADWGIAKSIRRKASASDTSGNPSPTGRSGSDKTEWGYYGTRSYMSPEQANGDVHLQNESTDIFLIGATLFALTYGQAPFATSNPHESLRKAADCEVDWDRPILPCADQSLINICKKAMEPEQIDRYPTAMALASDLERWLADQPLLYAKEHRRRKTARFLKRYSRSLAAATVVSLLGTAGLIVANYRISEARDIAVTAKKETETALDQKSAALVKAEESAIAEAKAKEEEVAARQLAEKNYAFVSNLALAMLNVVAQKLPAIPGMSKVRLEIAEDLGNRLGEFAMRPENQQNENIRLLWAKVEREAANVARFIGDQKRAKNHFRNALVVLNELVQNHPRRATNYLDLAQVFTDNAILDQMMGNFAAAEKSLNQAIAIVTSLRGDRKDPRLDEFEFFLHLQKSALLAQVGRDEDQKKVLDRIETLQRTWFAEIKAVNAQQFKLSVTAKFEFANHHLRANNHDLALKYFREALAQSEQKRKQVEAAKQEMQPDYLYLIGNSQHGLADALYAKADPASIQEAFGHYDVAYKTFFSLDKEAQGAASYVDNLLWAFVDMKRYERETQKKFVGLMDDSTALEKAEKLVAESSDPEKKALRAHILAEMAHQERNPEKRTELAKRAAADFEAVNEKLPSRKDRQNDLEKLRESFGLK